MQRHRWGEWYGLDSEAEVRGWPRRRGTGGRVGYGLDAEAQVGGLGGGAGVRRSAVAGSRKR